MRVTQTISIGTLRINSMSNSSIVQIGTSGAVKTRSEEITEVIPQQEANQKLEKKIYDNVKPHLAKEGIPTQKQPPGVSDTGWSSTAPEQKSTGNGAGGGDGSQPITGASSGAAHGDIGTEGSSNGIGKGNSDAGSAGNGYGVGNDSNSWYVDGNGQGVSNGAGRRRDVTTDAAKRGKTRT
jgi:spore germination protein PB